MAVFGKSVIPAVATTMLNYEPPSSLRRWLRLVVETGGVWSFSIAVGIGLIDISLNVGIGILFGREVFVGPCDAQLRFWLETVPIYFGLAVVWLPIYWCRLGRHSSLDRSEFVIVVCSLGVSIQTLVFLVSASSFVTFL